MQATLPRTTAKLFYFYLVADLILIGLLSLNDGFRILDDLNSTQFESLSEKMFAMQFYILAVFTFNLILVLFSNDVRLKKNSRREEVFLLCLWSVIVFIPAALSLEKSRNYLSKYFYLFGVGHLFPNFADLRGTIAAMNKVNEVGESFQIECQKIEEPCLGWRWTYGSAILRIPTFGIIREKNAPFIAFFLFVALIICFWYLAKTKLEIILFSVFAFSGTSLLIVERMNIDILVLPLIILISKLKKLKLLGSFCIFQFWLLLTLTKYYTFPLFFAFMILRRNRIERLLYLTISLFALYSMYMDLSKIGFDSFNFGYAATHGLKVLTGFASGKSYPGFSSSNVANYVVALTLFIIALFFFKLYKKVNFVISDDQFIIMFSLSYLVFFSTWLLSANYPYRLVSSFIFIPFFTRLFGTNILWSSVNLSLLFAMFVGIHITLSPLRNIFIGIFASSLSAIAIHIFRDNDLWSKLKKEFSLTVVG
jgi:hypothetical protein